MKKITEYFIVEYPKEEEHYIDHLVDHLVNNMKRILDFFELEKLETKKTIKIYGDLEQYRLHIEEGEEQYQEWMIADTNDGNINLLSLKECQKTNSHSDMTEEDFERNIIHEFVHICEQEYHQSAEHCAWFWEALALNLGDPFDHVVPNSFTSEELMDQFYGLNDAYLVAYTLGKFMLENYSKDRILNYVKDSELLIHDTDQIIEDAKDWFNQTYLLLPDIPKIEDDHFIIFSSDSFTQVLMDSQKELMDRYQAILSFFGLSDYRQIRVDLYDDYSLFRDFVKSIRSPKYPTPDYIKGCTDSGIIHSYIDTKMLKEDSKYLISKILHECCHIIYNEVLAEKRVLWLDEGLAMNLSHSERDLEEENGFIKLLNERIFPMKEYPNLNTLEHESNFSNDYYNGYELSYVVVRYLLEIKSVEEIRKIIKDYEYSTTIGQTILSEAIAYYKEKQNGNL